MRRTIKSLMMTMLRWLDPSGFVYRMGLKWASLYFSSHRVWFSTFVKFVSHFCINKLLRTSLILAKLQKKTAFRKKCRTQIYSVLSLSILLLLFKMMASTLTNFVCLFENVAKLSKITNGNTWRMNDINSLKMNYNKSYAMVFRIFCLLIFSVFPSFFKENLRKWDYKF